MGHPHESELARRKRGLTAVIWNAAEQHAITCSNYEFELGDLQEAIHFGLSLMTNEQLKEVINQTSAGGMAHLYSPEEALEGMETLKGSKDQDNMPYHAVLKSILNAAKEHGLASEPEHEAGDLQDAVHDVVLVLDNNQLDTLVSELGKLTWFGGMNK